MEEQKIPPTVIIAVNEPDSAAELSILIKEEAKTPKLPIIIMTSVLGLTTLFSLLKGDSTSTSFAGVKPCSPSYWLTSLAIVPLMMALTVIISYRLIKRHLKKVNLKYEYKVTKKNYMLCITYCFFSKEIFNGLQRDQF